MQGLGPEVTCPEEQHDVALQGGLELTLELAHYFLVQLKTVAAVV
jgi:hypothetical protein